MSRIFWHLAVCAVRPECPVPRSFAPPPNEPGAQLRGTGRRPLLRHPKVDARKLPDRRLDRVEEFRFDKGPEPGVECKCVLFPEFLNALAPKDTL